MVHIPGERSKLERGRLGDAFVVATGGETTRGSPHRGDRAEDLLRDERGDECRGCDADRKCDRQGAPECAGKCPARLAFGASALAGGADSVGEQ